MSIHKVVLLSIALFILSAPLAWSASKGSRNANNTNCLAKQAAKKAVELLENRIRWRMVHVYWISAVASLICVAVYYTLYLLKLQSEQLQRASPGAMNKRQTLGGPQRRRLRRQQASMSIRTSLSKQLSFGSLSGVRRSFAGVGKQKFSSRLTGRSAVQKSQEVNSELRNATTMRQVVSLKESKA